jgi:spermidine/putrescine-binding protein
MRNFLTLAAPFVLGFFVLGIGWGVWTKRAQQHQMSKAPPIRILCPENWVSEEVLNKFSQDHNVAVQLWTYQRPSEFLRQMANSDGRVDVICTSSLLIKSLIQSHWLLKTDFNDVPNSQLLSVDFVHLPYDPESEYALPLFWNLYGFFGKDKAEAGTTTWKQTWSSRRVTLWGEELSLLHVLTRSGVKVEEKLEQENSKNLEDEVRQFASHAAKILKPDPAPISAEAIMAYSDLILLPLGRVARLLGAGSPYRFWLPEDGGAVEVGLLAIGSKSENVKLAKALISELLSTEHALEVHRRLGTGVVHNTLNSVDAVAPLQKAEALRRFPLHRFTFPDVSIEALPRFQKIYDQTLSNRN